MLAPFALTRAMLEKRSPTRFCASANAAAARSVSPLRPIEEVIAIEDRAIRLSPRDPNIGNRYWRIGVVHLLQSRIDEAIAWLERARAANPEQAYFYVSLASAYGSLRERIARRCRIWR